MASEIIQVVHGLLKAVPTRGLEPLKQLFWSRLGYSRVNEMLPYRSWPDRARDALAEPPTLFANYGSGPNTFDIICATLSPDQAGRGFPLSLTAERLVINQLLPDHPYALFVFSDPEAVHWHLVNVKLVGDSSDTSRRRVLRRIAVGPHERLRTAAERVALLDISNIGVQRAGPLPGVLSPLDIQQCHDEAFDVEAVTQAFFEDYKDAFGALQTELERQTGDAAWAHDYALQFLNRLMFLYYVQRKGWLGENAEFVASYWKAYQDAERPRDTFVAEWLHVLFFEAFNNAFQAGRADRQYLPPDLRDTLALAPYLNGGLFQRNQLDRDYSPEITDARFASIFSFLEQYNFTISEDTPLDQEVAVDPEMIGKVYESLVNVSEEADERADAGIFYTPRVEIDLMCRLSLTDWLTNHLGKGHRELVTELVFAIELEDKEDADDHVSQQGLWPQIDELLRTVTVVDPACGSGSFLVGMLYVLDDLIARANRVLGVEATPYERKKQIIGNSLYGVDVMEWAVHVAELRLWLQLVIDTELAAAELRFRPLLPNLTFKVRPGDSIVQEVGGINLAMHQRGALSPYLKGRITKLKGAKSRFYQNDRQLDARQLRAQEQQLFADIVAEKRKRLQERATELRRGLTPTADLFGDQGTGQRKQDQAAMEAELSRIQAEETRLAKASRALRGIKNVPFVWDIAFVEVFESDRPGFDIVIGNPPYVRQEAIHDPHQPASEVNDADKRAYKAKLARAVYTAWPQSFGYQVSRDKAQEKLPGRSDLYIYFYLYGLSLLNPQGAFCFITSNAWLDVDYGKALQAFLLRRSKVSLVLDNKERRSFASADVNTVIVLLSAATDGRGQASDGLRHTARFVMLNTPYEAVLHPVIWQEVYEAAERESHPEYRVIPVTQEALLAHGTPPNEHEFAGDKWGGRFLRAPDIYWVIQQKAGEKLVRLDQVADVRRGITTGANAFFYLDAERIAQWGIEPEFLRPVVKSPKECTRIMVDPDELENRIFMCHQSKRALKSTAALEYIKWGESQEYHERPSCRGRARWWDLGTRQCPELVWQKSVNDRHVQALLPFEAFVDQRLYEMVGIGVDSLQLAAVLNSSLTFLFKELWGRVNLGEGALDTAVYEAQSMPVFKPNGLPSDISLKRIEALSSRNVLSILDEVAQPDRRALDDIIFDAIGLTQTERDDVYAAVIDLVAARLNKANSV